MKPRNLAGFFVGMMLVASVAASSLGFGDDFEDDTIGTVPTGEGYTYGRDFGSNSGSFTVSVENVGNPGQGLQFNHGSANINANWGNLILNEPGEIGVIEWDWDCGGGSKIGTIRAVGSGGTLFSFWTDSSCTLINAFSCPNVSAFGGHGGYANHRVEIDWDGGVFRWYVNDALVKTASFCSGGLSSITSWGIGGTGNTGTRTDNVDNFLVGIAPAAPTGLEATVTRLGSVSTSGKVGLSWILSVDDTEQNVGVFDYDIYVNGTYYATDTLDGNDGGGVRTADFLFTGAGNFGERDFTVKAVAFAPSTASCTATVDLDVLGSFGSCGDTVAVSVQPAEFDTGLVAAIESFGFQTTESKMLFSLMMIGGVQVVAGVTSKFMAAGRMKNYLILGTGAVVGVFFVFIDFLNVWEWIVAFMLGVFTVKGVGAARNTYFEIRDAIQDRRRFGDVGDVELKADVSDLGMGAEAAEMGRGGRSGLGGDLEAMEADDGRETGPEGSQEDES